MTRLGSQILARSDFVSTAAISFMLSTPSGTSLTDCSQAEVATVILAWKNELSSQTSKPLSVTLPFTVPLSE